MPSSSPAKAMVDDKASQTTTTTTGELTVEAKSPRTAMPIATTQSTPTPTSSSAMQAPLKPASVSTSASTKAPPAQRPSSSNPSTSSFPSFPSATTGTTATSGTTATTATSPHQSSIPSSSHHPQQQHHHHHHHHHHDSAAASASESSQSALTMATTATPTRGPLHSPSLASSPGGDAVLSEEESVAELGGVSEGECSSVEYGHASTLPIRRQDEEISKQFSSGVVAVAKRLAAKSSFSNTGPTSAAVIPTPPNITSKKSSVQYSKKRKASSQLLPSSLLSAASPSSNSIPLAAVKCARFSEPADDSESVVDRPIRFLRKSHTKLKKNANAGSSVSSSGLATPKLQGTQPQIQQRKPKQSVQKQTKRTPTATLPSSTSTSSPTLTAPQSQSQSQPTLATSLKTPSGSTTSPSVSKPTVQPPLAQDDGNVDHLPTSLPKFQEPRTCMWTSSHAANSPSEDRSSSLVNVLLQPLPPNFDSETQLPPLEKEYTSLVRLSLWSVIDGHGGGCVATYASEVLLPHIAATISRSLGCAIVDRGVCEVNGQLRDANALDLDGLIKTSGRNVANTNSIHYRSPHEANHSEDDDDDDHLSRVQDDATTTIDSMGVKSRSSTPGTSIPSTLVARSSAVESATSSVAASMSSVKTSIKTGTSTAARDSPVGTHSPSEIAAITRAITESFLAVDEGWINSIDPVATHQTSCQSNGRWNSGACALVAFTIQRLEWTSVLEADQEQDLRGPEKCRGHDTSQNKDAARRRLLDYAARAKSASSLSTISSTSSLTTTEDRVNTSGLESEITETEGEDDDNSTQDNENRRRNPFRKSSRSSSLPKESLISPPGGCACHCYRAYEALLYTAHVGDCRAVMLGSAPPRTIKVHGSSSVHTDATDDESSHHSSDETECLSSSDHDADSSDDEDVTLQRKAVPPSTTPATSSYMTYVRRPARRQRRRAREDFGANAPFIALPPLEGFQSIEIGIDRDNDNRVHRHRGNLDSSDPSDSSLSSQDSYDIIQLPPVTRPIDLTTDHSAYNPAEVTGVLRRCNNAPRAISAGVGGGIKRVAGSLAVTRALGDAYLKTPELSFSPYKRYAPYITAKPEVNCRPVTKDSDKIVVLATDGVWERATGEDVLRWVRTFYTERIAEVERRKNRRLNINQAERSLTAFGGETNNQDDDSDDRNDLDHNNRKRDHPNSPSPPANRMKRRLPTSAVSSGSTVADVIVRRVLNKVRRARNISSLHALMSLPQGRARRSKHDDITACVVDLSAFVS